MYFSCSNQKIKLSYLANKHPWWQWTTLDDKNMSIKKFLYLFSCSCYKLTSDLSVFSLFFLQNCHKCYDAVMFFFEVLGIWKFSVVWLAHEHLSAFHHGDHVFCSQDESRSVVPGLKQASHSHFCLINVSIPWPFMRGEGPCSPNVSKVGLTWAKIKVIVVH